MQSLSSEVALTSNVLRQLGDNLQQDEQARLYSNEALGTTQEVLQECRTVFEKIGDTIQGSAEQSSAKSRLRQAARKVGFMMNGQDLDVLRSSLERLKTTMLLLLNVIMYAGQLRRFILRKEFRRRSLEVHDMRTTLQAPPSFAASADPVAQRLIDMLHLLRNDVRSLDSITVRSMTSPPLWVCTWNT
ncbi:hypothetical protein BDW42DRAFT_161681 [Aspergillus taichungensis]|uniref:Fungal N-terminal domain-containing protein n=1 Tax=Aspergillus taichungensis TaxID=482145 RepID=A0A2J5I4I2_9EURO|nr:hypothetical protein BDW42DRAFT_161681 [Aspergillus taichungensis]